MVVNTVFNYLMKSPDICNKKHDSCLYDPEFLGLTYELTQFLCLLYTKRCGVPSKRQIFPFDQREASLLSYFFLTLVFCRNGISNLFVEPPRAMFFACLIVSKTDIEVNISAYYNHFAVASTNFNRYQNVCRESIVTTSSTFHICRQV